MLAQEFRVARKRLGWTQAKAAARLGVSQPYLALLEGGRRRFVPKMAYKAVKELKVSPTALPVRENVARFVDPQDLAQQFASVGYPGFAHLRAARKRNPAEVLLTALAQDDLESRLTEALPWLLLQYANNMNKDFLVEQARRHLLSNRLGFVVTLAKGVLVRMGDTNSARWEALNSLEKELQDSRLDKEDTLCQSSLSEREREWLQETRPQEAAHWHLLTDWRPEHLQYAF